MKPPLTIIANVYVSTKNHFIGFFQRHVVRSYANSFIIPSHKCWVLAALLLYGTFGFCTSGIVIITERSVIIGIDSAFTLTDAEGRFLGVNQGCKIAGEGDVFYLAAGAYTFPEFNFDVYAIAREAILKSKSLRDIFSAVEPPIVAVIPTIAKETRLSEPARYSKWIHGLDVVSISFTSFEGGLPIFVAVQFKIDDRGRATKPVETVIVPIKGQIQRVKIGNQYEMDKMLESRGEWLSGLDPVTQAELLIQSEIDASAARKIYDVKFPITGPPISVVQISEGFSGMVPGHEGLCGLLIAHDRKTPETNGKKR